MIDIKNHVSASIQTKEKILQNEEFLTKITEISKVIVNAFQNGKKLLTAGNGGSSCDAQHMASELVAKFYFERPALSAISLTTDTAVITAIGNDLSAEDIFFRQIQANGQEGDIFVAISTSGNSTNIVKAAEEAKKRKVIVIGLTGQNPCKLDAFCDYSLKVPSQNTPTIQESHIMLCHIICALVEDMMFNKKDCKC